MMCAVRQKVTRYNPIYGFVLCLCVVSLVSAQNEMPGNILYRPQLGTKKVLLIRVNYPDDATVILSDAQVPIHANSLNEIFKINSYDNLEFDIDVTPVLTMPQPTTVYQEENRLSFVRVRSDAVQLAEAAGYNEEDYDFDAIFTVKVWLQDFGAVSGMNLRTFYSSNTNAAISAHEMGHSFDWRHASFWQVVDNNPISPDGTLVEYGDKFDIMGDYSRFHHFNPWFKYRTGWIPPESILTVAESGIYTIRAIEKEPLSGEGIDEYTALRIRRDPNTEYWVYYRSNEDSANVGALISQISPQNYSRALLLDMTPGSRNEERDYIDAALTVGKTIRDHEAGIEITLLEKFDDSLRIQVSVPSTTMDNLPVINIVAPLLGKTIAGAIEYEATVFDPDAGEFNGAGIDTVTLQLGYAEGIDPYGVGTGFALQEERIFTNPPYRMSVETSGLPDEVYRIAVRAVSSNGGVNTSVLAHFIDNTGPSVLTPVANKHTAGSEFHILDQNIPNPFNATTSIQFNLAQDVNVILSIYDLIGRKVRSLIDDNRRAGQYSIHWDGRDDAGETVASGVYYYQLRADGFQSKKKMLMLK